ncbi:uncharacterized protein LOC132702424 [Cylas formicarius]|uniref:uncharacterized protein LOC132702424 n=1 Tax=Cylas formicarius TaxID=197179 RepID=UPI0029584533|nr:uncharacterized protein LOC132702424 [Cylas formicarius]
MMGKHLLIWFGLALICALGTSKKILQVTESVTLSQSLFWDEDEQSVLFVDVYNAEVYEHVFNGNTTSTKIEGEETISLVAPIEGKGKLYVVAGHRDILKLDCNDNREVVSKFEAIGEIGDGEVFSDGKVDSRGRLWIATLVVSDEGPYRYVKGAGSIYLITVYHNDTVKIERKLSNVTYSNGIEFSGDDKHIYIIESDTRTIHQIELDIETGELGDSKVIFDLHDHPNLHGYPSGIVLDGNDELGVSLYGSGKIIAVNPHTSEVTGIADIPVPNPTSLVYGGPKLDIKYISSSRSNVPESDLAKEVFDSGAIFASDALGSGFQSHKIKLWNFDLVSSPDIRSTLFLCEWDSRNRSQHWVKKKWPKCTSKKIFQVTESVSASQSLFWDEDQQSVLFVDLYNAVVYEHVFNGNTTSTKIEGQETISLVAPIEGKGKLYVVAGYRDILKLDCNDDREVVSKFKTIGQIGDGEQFSDGKVDSRGRLWIATLVSSNFTPYRLIKGAGSIYLITVHHNDTVKIEKKLSNVTYSNGIEFSADDKHIYIVESDTKTIHQIELDIESGELGASKVIFDLNDHPHLHGYPDGIILDGNGELGVSLFGSGKIIAVNPNTGEVTAFVDLPVPNPTSMVFGGPNLDIKYIASSRKNLHPSDLAKEVFDSGAIFASDALGSGFQSHKIRLV